MKKASSILSLLLTFCMIFSLFAFAVPTSTVGVESGEEITSGESFEKGTDDNALLQALTVYTPSIEFSTSNQGITFSAGGTRGNVGGNYCAGGTVENSWHPKEDDATDGYITAVFHKSENSTGTVQFQEMCNSPTSSIIWKSYDTSNLEAMEVRLRIRKTIDAPTYDWTGGNTFFTNAGFTPWGSGGWTHPTKDYATRIGEWQTISIDLSGMRNEANCTPTTSGFSFMPVIYGYEGYAMDIDYIHFIYDFNVVQYAVTASVDGQPLSDGTNNVHFQNGIFTFTFDKAPSIPAESFVADFLNSDANFSSQGVTVSEDGKTYTVYACKNLRTKTIAFNTVTNSTSEYAINCTVNFDASSKPGENVFVNGEFENPYLNLWTGSGFTTSIVKDENGKNVLKAVMNSSCTAYSTITYNDGTTPLTENTDYLFFTKMTYPSKTETNGQFDTSVWGTDDIGVDIWNYYPVLDTSGSNYLLTSCTAYHDNSFFVSSAASRPTQNAVFVKYPTINGLIDAGALRINSKPDTAQTSNRLFRVGSKSDYTNTKIVSALDNPKYVLQTRFKASQFNAAKPEGMFFYVNGVVLKEVFDVTVSSDGGTGDFGDTKVVYAANEPFTFPTSPYTKSGYYFAGWMYEDEVYAPGATVTPQVSGDGAMAVEAIWEPVVSTYAAASVKIGGVPKGTSGIRYLASIPSEVKETTTEYGFVITLASSLENKGIAFSDFTFDSDVVKASGKAYNKTEGIDKIYNILDDGVVQFSGVIYNIPLTRVKDRIVGRPYAIIDGVYYYGTPISKSIYEVAVAVKNDASSYDNLSETNKAKLDEIIDAGNAINQ